MCLTSAYGRRLCVMGRSFGVQAGRLSICMVKKLKIPFYQCYCLFTNRFHVSELSNARMEILLR